MGKKISGREIYLNYFNSLTNFEIADFIDLTNKCDKICPEEVFFGGEKCDELLRYADGCYSNAIEFLEKEFDADELNEMQKKFCGKLN